MKLNTPLGVLEFSDLLENYGYVSVDTSKPLKKLPVQTFEDERESLWYRDEENQVITEISCVKNKPQDYRYSCICGYKLNSGFDLDSIRCHECGELMEKEYTGKLKEVV